MRCFLTVSLVIASLAGHVYGLRQTTPSERRVAYRRKSLGFGPEHPHAVFRAGPYQTQTNGFSRTMDPLDVARIFVDDVLSPGSSYKIRKDSYTDKNTGVTHVYVRQLVNRLEVTDGDMNINIKDGVVLSYGNSVCWICNTSCDLELKMISVVIVSSTTGLVHRLLSILQSMPSGILVKNLVTNYSNRSKPTSLIPNKSSWARLRIACLTSSNTCLIVTVKYLIFLQVSTRKTSLTVVLRS
jgi:hypothetical protein